MRLLKSRDRWRAKTCLLSIRDLKSTKWQRRLRFCWKKYSWTIVIKGTLAIKRLLDIVLSFTALIMLSPIFLIVAILIKLQDGGPVLYWQIRVGQGGRGFRFLKFRTMVCNADEIKLLILHQNAHGDDITFKLRKDPRVTPLGKWLRRFSIDEFPQFWNVLIGEMSLVGPRPPIPKEVERYSPEERRRLDIKPGLTCIWQVGGRAQLPFRQQYQLDLQYIYSQSLWIDCVLLLKTIPAVLLGKGAY